MTNQELLDLINARAAGDTAFATLLAERRDAEMAALLSVGRTRVVSRNIGGGTIVATLGSGALLKAMRAYAPTEKSGTVDEILRVIDRGDWDVGNAATRAKLDEYAAAGVIPAPAVAALMALANVPDPITPSQVSDAINGGA